MLTIIVSDHSIGINNLIFEEPFPISAIYDHMGPANVVHFTNVGNTIHSYDDYGIYIYEKNGIIKQISLLIGEPYLDVHPKKRFAGKLLIKDKELITLDDILSIQSNEIWFDEWEAEGSLEIRYQNTCCHIAGYPESNEIQDIDLYFPDE